MMTKDQKEVDGHDNLLKRYGCSLCNEVFIHAFSTNCHHKFCRRCILKWLRYCRKCPECISIVIKMTPMKRMDAEIERIYQILPFSYRKHREELKRKRLRAELNERNSLLFPQVLSTSTSHVDRMKVAEGIRQKLKESRTSRKFRSSTVKTGQSTNVTVPSKSLSIKLTNRSSKSASVNGKKLATNNTGGAKFEFLKRPPPKGLEQDSTEVSIVSSEGRNLNVNDFKEIIDGGKIIEKHFVRSHKGYDTPESTFESFSSPALSSENKAPHFIGGQKPKTYSTAKEKERAEINRRLCKNNPGKVEDFLKKCPVETIWDHDLFTFLKLQGNTLNHDEEVDHGHRPEVKMPSSKKVKKLNQNLPTDRRPDQIPINEPQNLNRPGSSKIPGADGVKKEMTLLSKFLKVPDPLEIKKYSDKTDKKSDNQSYFKSIKRGIAKTKTLSKLNPIEKIRNSTAPTVTETTMPLAKISRMANQSRLTKGELGSKKINGELISNVHTRGPIKMTATGERKKFNLPLNLQEENHLEKISIQKERDNKKLGYEQSRVKRIPEKEEKNLAKPIQNKDSLEELLAKFKSERGAKLKEEILSHL